MTTFFERKMLLCDSKIGMMVVVVKRQCTWQFYSTVISYSDMGVIGEKRAFYSSELFGSMCRFHEVSRLLWVQLSLSGMLSLLHAIMNHSLAKMVVMRDLKSTIWL